VAEERTEQATPRRREEARKRGEVARSAELAAAAALLGALLGLRLGWHGAVASAAEMIRLCLRSAGLWPLTIQSTPELLQLALHHSAEMLMPAAALACAAATAVNLAQGGLAITPYPLAPRWRRISVSEGFRRMFSLRGYFAVLRCLVKLAAVAVVTFCYLRSRWELVLGLAQQSALGAGQGMGALLWGLLIRVAGVLLAVALADYLFQRHQHEKNLRMTRHELREEHKHTEGDPLLRARLRERQRALARHRMLQAVKKATVVVVNPVEVAVALRYEVERTPAPVVVAKGQRLMAGRIRSEAEKHGVPIIPNPDLARALYRSVPVGRQIPPELYQAVAEIIAFIYRLTGRQVA